MIRNDTTTVPTKTEVIQSLEPFVEEHLGTLLKPVEESWQPSDWLPDLTAEDWPELPLEKQSAILKELVKGIEYDGHNGKLWIELNGGLKKHEFDLPLEDLKKRLPDTTGIAFENEPLIRKQLLLAHQIQGMLADGRAKDLKQISGWTGISLFRLYQIVNLLYLCPEVQEDILTAENASLVKITERNCAIR